VVRIDGTGRPECHPGELRLRGCDNRVDLVAPADLGQRVDVPAVLGPDLADQGTPRGGSVSFQAAMYCSASCVKSDTIFLPSWR
jgi:hypothetical protein